MSELSVPGLHRDLGLHRFDADLLRKVRSRGPHSFRARTGQAGCFSFRIRPFSAAGERVSVFRASLAQAVVRVVAYREFPAPSSGVQRRETCRGAFEGANCSPLRTARRTGLRVGDTADHLVAHERGSALRVGCGRRHDRPHLAGRRDDTGEHQHTALRRRAPPFHCPKISRTMRWAAQVAQHDGCSRQIQT